MNDFCTITTTCPNQAQANAIAHMLLDASVAACVQIDSIASHYVWDGAVCHEPEYRLQIKSRNSLFARVCDLITAAHSYQVPEIIATDLTHISPAYQAWLDTVLTHT